MQSFGPLCHLAQHTSYFEIGLFGDIVAHGLCLGFGLLSLSPIFFCLRGNDRLISNALSGLPMCKLVHFYGGHESGTYVKITDSGAALFAQTRSHG